MKKSIIAVVVSAFLLSACTDSFLDVENRNNLDEGSFLKTEYDLQLAVNSAYCPLGHDGMYGLQWTQRFGTMDDRTWWETPTSFDVFLITLNDFSGMYDELYRGVFRCADILSKKGKLVPGIMTEEAYAPYEAQLRALRAMYYFNLVTLFKSPYFYNENNVPTDPMAYYGNSESELFWNQIDIDLKFATEHLPPSYEASELGRITKGAAYALWGKVKLWKHYYYYIENDLEGTAEATQNLADAKTYLNWVITSGLYELQGEPGGSNPAVTKQDYLNALTSNFAFIDIEMPGGKVYASENNVESIWEVQYNSEKRGDGWLPAWQWGGAKNYQFFGVHNSSYKNQEMDPDAFYVYDETAAGMPAFDAGFDRDPRAYATFFLDETPTHEADLMDWRDNGYNVAFRSAANSKGTVMKQHLYQGTMPLGTGGIMRKKYSFPQFTTADASVAAPNCDPFNYRVIRFADVLLMYAEACYLSGSDETAGLSALNRVRLRAGMNTVDALSEAVIIKERDMELMGESFRFLDIVRWSRDSRWFNAINFSSNTPLQYDFLTNFTKYTTPDPKYPYRLMYMPIPQTEINKNGGQLKQNPGW